MSRCPDCPELLRGPSDPTPRTQCCMRQERDPLLEEKRRALDGRNRTFARTNDGGLRVVNRAERRQLARRQRLGLKP